MQHVDSSLLAREMIESSVRIKKVAEKCNKSTKDVMQMMDLNETIDHLAKVNSVC